MPGNEVGDRVHNFFAQDNLSQGHHSQAVGANWPSVNNLWVGGNQKQVGAQNSDPRFHNPQQSEIERVPVPHGFNFMQTTSRPEFANNPSQNQQQNLNGYMYGRHVLQTRPDEANFLGLDTDPDQNNVNQRGFLGYESQQEGVSEQISRNSDRSDAFDAHGSLDLFGHQNQMNNEHQHPGLLQPVQQQQSGFNDIQHLQMLRKMQEIQRQKSMRQQNSVNQASHGHMNGTPTSESSWSEFAATGNTNWLQRGSPAVQGSSSRLVFSAEPGQPQRAMGFPHQQVDQSLYGVPVSNSRGPLNPYSHGPNSSFPGNQYAGIQEQAPSKTSFGHTSGQASNSGINMEQIQQLKPVQDKPAIEAASPHAASSLNPDEEKFLFSSDASIWDAFGSDENMGEGAINLFDDNDFVGELPSLQSGSWSALMQSAVEETTSTSIGLQEEWNGLNIQNLENQSGRPQKTPLAAFNVPNAAKMNDKYRDKQNAYDNPSGQVNQQNDWNPIDSVPPHRDASLNINDNLLQQFQNSNRKRVKHEEIGQGDGIWRANNALSNPNVDLEPINTSIGSPQINREGGMPNFGQFPSNNHQLNYWKHVQSSVNLSKLQLHPNKGSQVSESSLNSSDKEDLKMHEIESRSKRENSNDSYQSSSSHQANNVRLRENSSSKQSLLNQAGRKTSGARKFQYHPMGNLDEDVEMPYGARQGNNTQAMSLQHFQGLRDQDQVNLGHSKITGQVSKSSAEMRKGHVQDLEGITKGSLDMRSKGMIGGQVPNMFASFDKSVGLSTSEKASQPSQNMLELLHKVDNSRDGGTLRHFNSSERFLSSEMPEPEYSDGSFGGLQRTHSSNSQGPSLQLGPPSQRLPFPNTSQNNVPINNSNSSSQAHVSHNLRDKGQSVLPSLPPKNNRIGSSEQNASEISAHKMTANLSSSLGANFPNSRSQLQNSQMISARGLDSTNNSDNEPLNRRNGPNNSQSLEGRLPNKASFGRYNDLPTQQQLFATQILKEHSNLFQSRQLNIVDSTSLNNQEAEKRTNLMPNFASPSPNLSSLKVDQGQTTNGPLGKESVIEPVSDSSTQKDLEAFGRSLKPNNFHQNYSLMNQTSTVKNIDNDPSNRETKRLKGPDIVVGDVSTCRTAVPSGDNTERNVQSSVPSNNMISNHISPQMAPSWFDQHGTFKNGQLLQRVDMVRSIEQPFSVGKVSGGLELHNLKEQTGPAPLLTNVGVENIVAKRPKKRRLATDDLRPWLVEVSGSFKNLQNICTGALEWSRSAYRLMEKVDDDGDVIEDVLPMMSRPKRRLILTTLLMQQLLRPPPSPILSTDAGSNHESVVYYTARLALGDACNLVSSARNRSSILPSEADCQSDKSKLSDERIDDDRLSKVVQDFMSRAGMLEDEFLRLDKRASIADLRVECQDLERFSVITRFARFHGRAQVDGPEASSSDAAAHASRPIPQRYVTAVALPTNLPERVNCLSL